MLVRIFKKIKGKTCTKDMKKESMNCLIHAVNKMMMSDVCDEVKVELYHLNTKQSNFVKDLYSDMCHVPDRVVDLRL